MAITVETTALTVAYAYLREKMTYGEPDCTFKLYASDTLVDDFTRVSSDFDTTGGQLTYDSLTPLVFTIPPATTNVDSIRLYGNFQVGGEQLVGRWDLASTPTDERKNFPNGGTLSLGQWVMGAEME